MAPTPTKRCRTCTCTSSAAGRWGRCWSTPVDPFVAPSRISLVRQQNRSDREMTIAAWCVLAFLIIAYAPRAGSIRGAIAQEGRYDNINPRAQQARLEGAGAKAQAAHANSLEAFAPFAAGVWAAHAFGADPMIRDGLALAFVAVRLVYWRAYVADWGNGRSVVWALGFLITVALFVAAGLT
ncbi:hypothetical protein CKO24_00325 [Rhodothalassium salexigens DSM 2132]|nr:hypothetical protein [Rhodothalassium salexigens DSM 2132]